MKKKQMTQLQRQVLRDCREVNRPLSQILRERKVPTILIESWMRNSTFRERLLQVRKSMKHLRETDIAIGSAEAATFLRTMIAGPAILTPWDQRVPVAVHLCVLAERSKPVKRARSRLRGRPVRGRDLIHPDHTPEEASALLDKMVGIHAR